MEIDKRGVLWWNVGSNVSSHCIPLTFSLLRHVAKTGDIKDFLITEESGIAKGTRRIIAVTGQQATEARRVGDALQIKLQHLDGLSGKDKDSGLRAFQVVCLTVGSGPNFE